MVAQVALLYFNPYFRLPDRLLCVTLGKLCVMVCAFARASAYLPAIVRLRGSRACMSCLRCDLCRLYAGVRLSARDGRCLRSFVVSMVVGPADLCAWSLRHGIGAR